MSEDWVDGTGEATAEEIGEEEFLFGRSDTEEEATLTHANPYEAAGTTDPMRIQSTGDEQTPKDLNSPVKPSARAVERHEYTHLPFRPWCNVCVEARAREDGHFRSKPKDEDRELEGNALPVIALVYQ